MKKIKLYFLTFLLFPLVLLAQCPSNTTVSGNSVTFVGELTDMGGDTTTYVWFEYGTNINNLYYKTEEYARSSTGFYCITVSNLSPCTTYYYRAVARNQGGTAYGEIKSFTTSCNINNDFPSVDIKANNSDGPLTVNPGTFVTIHWNTSNVYSCVASGAWSGNKPLSGSERTPNLSFGRYEYILTCNSSRGTVTDRVVIEVPGGKVAGAATAVPTGIFNNNQLSSLLFPFFIVITFIWLFKNRIEKIINFVFSKKR